MDMNATAEMLRQRSFEFAVRVVKLARFLSQEKQDWVLARQVLRSGTSIGANIRESRFAQSKADFISKLSIALKEASETQYWLELLSATALLTKKQGASLKADVDWLVGTLVNVIKSSKRNLNATTRKQPNSTNLTI
jgi:four helix bundle protein